MENDLKDIPVSGGVFSKVEKEMTKVYCLSRK